MPLTLSLPSFGASSASTSAVASPSEEDKRLSGEMTGGATRPGPGVRRTSASSAGSGVGSPVSKDGAGASASASASAPLAPSHPLAAELAALRSQIAQYRAAAHQAGIQLQGVRLELDLARDEATGLRAKNKALSAEVETLRTTPDPPTSTPPSNTLAELSLAHRRLSAKLDFTEQQLSATTLELASTTQELQRVQKRADTERAELVELRRVEEDREEEILWERSERKRIQEQKQLSYVSLSVLEQSDLSDLALAEYAALVSRLDPRAVPPPLPRKRSDDILQAPPELGAPPLPPKEAAEGKDKAGTKPETPKIDTTSATTASSDKVSFLDDDDDDDEDELIAIPGPSTDEPRKSHESRMDSPTTTKSESATSPTVATASSTSPTAAKASAPTSATSPTVATASAPSPTAAKASSPTSPTQIAAAARKDAAPADVLAMADSISNLVLGQRGVHRLFRDFSSTLATKEKEIRELQIRAEGVESELALVRQQLTSETAARVDAQSERDRALRDDASAAKVVERYMTFSQKAHETVHAHLGQLRVRSAATQATLRTEATALRRRLQSEADRAVRLRAAAEEMAEELGKESAGRRREVALRLQLIAADEARARRADAWVDRVRRARAPEAADVLDPPTLGALLDEGADILAPPPLATPQSTGWGRRLLRRKSAATEPRSAAAIAAAAATSKAESFARAFLSDDLIRDLIDDLEVETQRRIDLEQQRVAWLAKEAEDGVPASTELGGGLVFDAEDEGGKKQDEAKSDVTADGQSGAKKEEDKPKAEKEEAEITEGKRENDKDVPKDKTDADDIQDRTPAPVSSPPPPPHLDELTALFEPLFARYKPLQKSLHDQGVSLASLRAAFPDVGPAVAPGKKGPLRALGLRPARTAREDLAGILDGLHEVIEDASVDAEIAVADEDRTFHGFAALLGVGQSGVVQASSVLRDAREYAASRSGENTPFGRLDARVADIEHDIALIKRTRHETEGMDAPAPPDETEDGAGAGAGASNSKEKRRRSVWAALPLRTVTPQAARPAPIPTLAPVLTADGDSDDDSEGGDARSRSRVSLLSTVGRTFSSGVAGAASNVAGAPRRVTDFAGGLYRPRKSAGDEARPLREGEVDEQD